MSFKNLTDGNLDLLTRETAKRERAITLELLKQLAEVERRHLYSRFACSSLHMYCVNELKMTDGDAGRKVSAARLLRDVPDIEEKVLNGSVAVTSVAQVAAFLKREARAGTTYELEDKLELLTSIENLSTRKIESLLIAKSIQPEIHFRETQRPVGKGKIEIKMYVDDATLENIEKLKARWSHALPKASVSDIIKKLAEESVERIEQARKSNRAPALEQTKASIRRAVGARDEGKCTFTDEAGKRCGSTYFIEEDHIIPKAMGGDYSVENIRLRCRAHNQRHAINTYGMKKMNEHLNRHH